MSVVWNDLMATHKWSKETNSDFIARIWSAEHFNFKRYSIEREVIWKNMIFNKNCTKMVNRTFIFKPVFTFWLLDLNIWRKYETFNIKLFTLLPDKLF